MARVPYLCPKCGSNDHHEEYYKKLDNGEEEATSKCVRCGEEFDPCESMDFEWDCIHYNWIYERGGKNAILKYIYQKVNGEKFEEDREVDYALDQPFFNYSCYILFGVRGEKILKEGKAFLREIEIDKILN